MHRTLILLGYKHTTTPQSIPYYSYKKRLIQLFHSAATRAGVFSKGMRVLCAFGLGHLIFVVYELNAAMNLCSTKK
jgi:hypothetical protein